MKNAFIRIPWPRGGPFVPVRNATRTKVVVLGGFSLDAAVPVGQPELEAVPNWN